MSNLTITELLDKRGRGFLNLLNAFTEVRGLIDFSELITDHICYRCGSNKSFKELYEAYCERAALIDVSQFGGRSIAYFLLNSHFDTKMLGDIRYLELCDQKLDGSQVEGFEHVEVYPRNVGHMNSIIAGLRKTDNVVVKVRPGRTTYDIRVTMGLTFTIEPEPLIEKIMREKAQKKIILS
ncbi:MAG: YecM protein [Candidatus Parcubacteria bacterium]|jgi:predicted metalloenzyme YecM